MNVDKLLKALDDDTNENLLNFTTEKMGEMNLMILKELHLSNADTMSIYKKLKHYKYVDELSDLKVGTYIRWIPIENPKNIHLTKGAIFCEINVIDYKPYCLCKNIYGNHFQIKMESNLIFQKLTQQEQVLLHALDHLSS